ncbi:MAG: hypothetical protein JWQ14_545 [Adhaeribacter sp.]|jgi:hypothetical protein|nr:hypothetical protein [Adhaeribacter sp.]
MYTLFDNSNLDYLYLSLQENYHKIRSLGKPYLLLQKSQRLLSLFKNTDDISEAIEYCFLVARYLLNFKNQPAKIRKL